MGKEVVLVHHLFLFREREKKDKVKGEAPPPAPPPPKTGKEKKYLSRGGRFYFYAFLLKSAVTLSCSTMYQ